MREPSKSRKLLSVAEDCPEPMNTFMRYIMAYLTTTKHAKPINNAQIISTYTLQTFTL